ncbi:molybdate ABC transporter substrate-binding protein [Microbacterium koreense]|uniref:Molybdate ABC transporter substrate-binding protein n=1 Tax=Microbacterium koreense TaxID=323761 RepID=A0ABW2ZQ01_9MICO
MRRIAASVGAAAALAALLAACATDPEAGSDGNGIDGTLTVYAAASLRSVFDDLALRFEARHPGIDVLPIVADGSTSLATQILEGAPADVFASADERTMTLVAEMSAPPELFASNTLVLVAPATSGVTSLADLADPALTVVLCAPDVPCGAASTALLDAVGVEVAPASLEQNVTAVLAKVTAGEADAGLVYATDARGIPDIIVIEPEGAVDVVNRYPITVMDDAGNPVAAAAFVDFVLGDEGQQVLADAGFGGP